jgi:16S rRNA (guanine1207-N2)-methyltransferase
VSEAETIIVERVRGVELRFHTRPGVFSRKGLDAGSRLLIEEIEVRDGSRIADLGCGTGVIGMACARLNPHGAVDLLDDHLRAVELAKQNLELNRIANARVQLSDLFSAVEGERYDQICANLPAQLGNEFLEEAVAESQRHLREAGSLWIVVVRNLRPVIQRLLIQEFGNEATVARGSQHAVLMAEKHSDQPGRLAGRARPSTGSG